MKLTRYNTQAGGIIAIVVIIVVIIAGTITLGKMLINKIDGDIKPVWEHRYDGLDDTNSYHTPAGIVALDEYAPTQAPELNETLWVVYWTDDLNGRWYRLYDLHASPEAAQAILWALVKWDIETAKDAPPGSYRQMRSFYKVVRD